MSEQKLFIVDDEMALIKVLKEAGLACGYEVCSATMLEEFKQQFPTFRPTFVMLDLNLANDTDGIEILRFLAEQFYKHPILLTSGQDEKVLATAIRLGEAQGLQMLPALPKPVRIAQIMEALQKTKPMTATEERLAKAIDEKELILHYQPKISCRSLTIESVEALVRWQPPHQSLIFPDTFIPLAEETGLVGPLTEWVIHEAFKQYTAWKAAGTELSIAINLSAKSLNDLTLPDTLARLAKELDVPPPHICLELTETVVMSQPMVAMDILTRLRIKGFSLSMDDFGTGYSSLVELQRMPFNQMKIDKSFIKNFTKDASAQAITRASILLAHSLGLNVVAEGVETKEAFDFLKALDCDEVQGYYFCRPLPADDLIHWMKSDFAIPK